jgi:hypothetical protein
MEQRGSQNRAFVVETLFKNDESVIVIQRKFRLHFNVPRHGRILWVHNFRTTTSATKKKQGGSERTVRTPEKVEAVRNAIEQIPRRSAISHAQALRSDTTARRILHQDLNFQFFKNYSYGILKLQHLLCLLKKKNNFSLKSGYALLLVKPSGFTGGPCIFYSYS